VPIFAPQVWYQLAALACVHWTTARDIVTDPDRRARAHVSTRYRVLVAAEVLGIEVVVSPTAEEPAT
jgi:hypothetical protein